MAIMALMSALAMVLMLFDFPILFIAPNFYKLDFSEIPVLLGGFMLGPVASVIIELVKILLKLLIKGTSTGGVGELANFCVGCALTVPASIFYFKNKSRKSAIIGMVVGTVLMAVLGVFLNYYIMIPFYENFMPLDQIIAAGAAINPAISTKWNFCWFAVAPFNLFKGVLVSLITMVIYKRVSRLLKGVH
jgi:riboflavin transporter FmnP